MSNHNAASVTFVDVADQDTGAANRAVEAFATGTWTAGVIGLGYVGLPLATTVVEAGLHCIGFDVSPQVVERLGAGTSHIDDVSDRQLRAAVDAGHAGGRVWLAEAAIAYAVVAGVSVTVAGVLLVTSAIPPLLAPIVLGPLGAVAMTALLAPKGDSDHQARRPDTDRRRV